ncbi:MAG TPA: asparagine synthase-related protein, partial [Jiangellaceae bacterium]|nr:asparagine synthase-related protein [Jiangellaceae bacterium]
MAMAACFQNHLAVFHADVTGPLSEREAAQKVARHLKLDFQSVAVRDQDFIDSLPEVMDHYGYPFTGH